MSFKRGALISVCAASLLAFSGAGSAFAAKSEILSSYGTWGVRSVQNAGQGKAPYCAMAKRFTRKTVLTVAKNANSEASLAVDFGRLVLNPKNEIDIVLDPGAGQMREQAVKPTSGQAFIVRLGQDDSFFGALRRTGSLRVEAGQNAYALDMSDIDSGLQKLDECLVKLAESDAQAARIRELEAQTTEVNELKKQYGQKIESLEQQISALTAQKNAGKTKVSEDMDIPVVPAVPVASVGREKLPSLNAPQKSFVGQDIEDVLKTLRDEKAALQSTLQKRAQDLVQRSEEGLRELQAIRSETEKIQSEKLAMQKRLEELEAQNRQLAMQAEEDAKQAQEKKIAAEAEKLKAEKEQALLLQREREAEELEMQKRLEELEAQNRQLAMQAEADAKRAQEEKEQAVLEARQKALNAERQEAKEAVEPVAEPVPLNLALPPADLLKAPIETVEPVLEVRMPVQQAEAQNESLNKAQRIARSNDTLNSIAEMSEDKSFKIEEHQTGEGMEPSQSAQTETVFGEAPLPKEQADIGLDVPKPDLAPTRIAATKIEHVKTKPIDNFFDEPDVEPAPVKPAPVKPVAVKPAPDAELQMPSRSIVAKEALVVANDLPAGDRKPTKAPVDLSRVLPAEDVLKSPTSVSAQKVAATAPMPVERVLEKTPERTAVPARAVSAVVAPDQAAPDQGATSQVVPVADVVAAVSVQPPPPAKRTDLPSLNAAPVRRVPVETVAPQSAAPNISGIVSDTLKRAGVIQGPATLKVVKQDAVKRFKAYEWRAGSVFGSGEERGMASADAFEDHVLAYLEKTQNRCQGDFAIVPADSVDVGARRIDSYEIACVGSGVDASATLIFTHMNNTFMAVAHEAPTNALAEAMDLRDKVMRALKAG